MARAVRFDEYGDESVLYIADIEIPEPSQDGVVVRVRTAGVSTGEVGIRSGAMDEISPAHFPEGEGSELAGIVHSVGGDVKDFAVGDAVIGLSDTRGAQADYAVVPASNVFAKPEGLGWDTAAAIPAAGATATAVIDSVKPQRGDTLVVAGASGSVGVVVVQLAVASGSRVIATASDFNHDYLRELGAEPVAYGDGLEDRLRALAPDGIDAFADCHGDGNVDLAISLGVDVLRINTIKDFETAKKAGTSANGMYQLDDITAVLEPFAARVASGDIRLPIKETFPLDRVQDAYRRLTEPGGIGKIVLIVSSDDE